MITLEQRLEQLKEQLIEHTIEIHSDGMEVYQEAEAYRDEGDKKEAEVYLKQLEDALDALDKCMSLVTGILGEYSHEDTIL